MATSLPQVRLAGADLGDHRHVCALVDGPDDAAALLLPFVLDGLTQGDRALHIVDPGTRDDHAAWLAGNGVDVDAALAADRLVIRTWTETYLAGGRFDRTAQFGLIRDALDEGKELGYPRTRVIGVMEWAVDATPIDDLRMYEMRVDALLRRRPDVVVCSYDLQRHSARTVADVLGAHSVAVVAGGLRTNRVPSTAPARERILDAGSQLFHRRGIQATGIDAIIRAADVAKATFYRQYPSKNDLVVAWLRDPGTRWLDRIRGQVDLPGVEPGARIARFFDAVAEWLEGEGFRGCPYLNTGAEITEPDHPARPIVQAYLQEIEDYLAGLIAAAGHADARRLAAEIQTLTAGAIALVVAHRTIAPVVTARDAALRLIAAADRAR